MKITCTNCGHQNPAGALYCADCGLVLASAGRSAPAQCCNSGAWIALAAVAGLSIVSGLFTFGVGSRARFEKPANQLEDHDFDLSPYLADAIYDLLAPSDIKVIVGRRNGGVSVRGTPREIETLREFVAMLTHSDDTGRHFAHARTDPPMPSMRTQLDIRLPRSKAHALIRVLQGAESPLPFSGSGRTITIHAAAADLEIIDGVVDILQGRR